MKVKFQNMFKDASKAEDIWSEALHTNSNFFNSRGINIFQQFQIRAGQIDSNLYNFIK